MAAGLAKPFSLLVTHVTKFHGLVKIFGQTDLSTGEVVEKYLQGLHAELESGQPASAAHISPSQSVIARHDGKWYRAKVNTLSGIRVSVTLVDTGETQICNLTNIRTGIHGHLQAVAPLAEEFILGEVIPPGGDWSKPSIEFVRDALQHDVCKAIVIHRSHGYNFIRVFKPDCREPLTQDMVQCGMAISGYPDMDNVPAAENYSPPRLAVPPMMQRPTGAYMGPPSPNYPPPVSPRPQQVHNQYNNHQVVTSWSDGRNGRPLPVSRHSPVPRNTLANQGYSGSSSVLLRPLTLETGTWYPVFISAVEEGPNLFHLQLESLTKKLEGIMSGINSIPLNPLPKSQIEGGMACLARYSADNSIYRSVILQRAEKAKVLYLDYGNTEVVSLDELYELPDNFRSVQMLSVECSLYQWPDIPGGIINLVRRRFETLTERQLNCRVMSIESGGVLGPRNIVQLYEDAVDVGQELRLWAAQQQQQQGVNGQQQHQGMNSQKQNSVAGPWLPAGRSSGSQTAPWAEQKGAAWSQGNNNNVEQKAAAAAPTWSQGSNVQFMRAAVSFSQVELVGAVDVFLSYHGRGPSLFYVQRADTTKQVQQIMREVASIVKSSPLPLSDPRPGAVCLAQYSDNVWYRARVVDACAVQPGHIRVEFVDFGNSDSVRLDQVVAIPPGLVTCLPAQAVPCKLAGNFGTQSDSLVKPFLDLVSDNVFRVKVEKVLSNVCVVQASTTLPPLVNINSELSQLVPHLALTPSMGDKPIQLLVTHFESTNSFYGQDSARGTELAIYLANLAEYCNRLGARLYSGLESHIGEVCATVDSSHANYRFYRCKVIREQRSTVDVRLLDIGGTERLERGALISLPEELRNLPEFGFQCSLGLTVSVTDTRLRTLFLDNFIEVVRVETPGDISVVKLTQNNSVNIRNTHILRFLKDLSPPTTKHAADPYTHEQPRRLADLYERQNKMARPGPGRTQQRPKTDESRQHDREEERPRPHQPSRTGDRRTRPDEYKTGQDETRKDRDGQRRQMDDDFRHSDDKGRDRGQVSRTARKFERGDLRNSLRERRAAREITIAKPIASSFKYPRLQVGLKFRGKITWMFDPGHFYVQLQKDEAAFNSMMDNMQAEFRSGPYEPRSWDKGTPVAAKYQDNCWYRGKTVGQRGKLVEVYFVDFGNTDKVDATDVLALPAEFGDIEAQALKCSLVGIEEINGNWEKLASGFAKYFVDPQYNVAIVKVGRQCLVDLNDGQVAGELLREFRDGGVKNRGEERLRKNRRKEKEASSESDNRSDKGSVKTVGGGREENPTKPAKKSGKRFVVGGYPEVEVSAYTGSSRTVLVSHYNSWRELWVQDNQDQTILFTKQLNEDKELLGQPKTSLQVGDSCIAVWDGLWYRALVQEVTQDKIKVHFVDYGNTEVVSLSETRTGDKTLYTIPPFALKCKLDDRIANFDKIMEKANYNLNVKFKSFFKNQFVIKLEKEKQKKKDKDTKADLGADQPKSRKGEVSISLTYVESVRRLWFVPEDRMDELAGLMQELGALTLSPAEEVREGGVYAVRYSEDGELYRVRVVERTEDGVEVELLDYGNHEVLEEEEILQMPDQYVKLPGFARVLNLKGAEYALDCEELKERLEEHLMEAPSLRVQMAAGKNSEVGLLIVDGKPLNLSTWLRYKEPNFNLFRHLGSVRIDCYVSNTEPAGQLWIIEKGMLEGLERMMQDLQARAKGFGKLKRVEKGRLVCTRFSEDADFYRVKILEVKEETVDVHYLDFGNRETVPRDQLLELSREFILHPGFAMKVEVDSKGDCRMLAPGEMETVISQGTQLTAELVQPRLGVVRFYMGGARVGYQSPVEGAVTSVVSLPPARLRLGIERLGLITLVNLSSFAVQDLAYLTKVRERILRENLEPVPEDRVEPGSIYILEKDAEFHRVVVLQVDLLVAQVKYIDRQDTQETGLGHMYTCPPRLLSLPPAAVTAASLTASTRDRYQLTDKLVILSVQDKSLKLAETNLRVTITIHDEESFNPKFTFPELSLALPTVTLLNKLSSTELCRIRNSVIQAYIDNREMNLAVPTLDPRFEELYPTEGEEEAVQDDFYSLPQQLDSVRNSVKVHPDLPEIILQEREKLRVVSFMPGRFLVSLERGEGRVTELRAALSSVGVLSPLEPCAADSLGLYNGAERCLVLQVTPHTAEIYLLDTGRTVLCEPGEISSLPEPLVEYPPTVFTVHLSSVRIHKPGDILLGQPCFADRLEIIEQ